MAEEFQEPHLNKSLTRIPDTRTPIFEIKGDPDHIIREYLVGTVEGKADKTAVGMKKDMEEVGGFGINVPRFDVIMGTPYNENSYPVQMYVDRVHGVSLEHASPPREVAEQFLENLLKYYKHKLDRDEEFLYDMHLEEFMYGKVKGDAEDKIYLVDLDPKLKSDPFEFFARVSGYILEMINGLEKSSGGEKFIGVRESNYELYKKAREKLPRKVVYFLSEEERIRKMYLGEEETTEDIREV